MITTIFFDLGETLIREDKTPFPHVIEALGAISQLKDQNGAMLVLGIISNFGEPSEIESEEDIKDFETEFREILHQAGIEDFFQPFDRRVTISARAGAMKPDDSIFLAAAKRAGADITECLFITETRDHLAKAKQLGIAPLGFGDMGTDFPSFSDWRDAPSSVERILST